MVGSPEDLEVAVLDKGGVRRTSDVIDVIRLGTKPPNVLPSWVRGSIVENSLIDLVSNPSSDEDVMINNLAVSQRTILNKGYLCDFKGIHSPSAVRFYKDCLGASPEVINILNNGYYPQFISEPPLQYFKDNNRSARENMNFVR